MNTPHQSLWNGDYKIPWHDPAFSRRMLAEHLAQSHDLASRRTARSNGFSPAEVLGILCRAHASLASRQGTLILEVQTPEAVERAGRSEPVEEQLESGLFSDRPYRCRTESQWLPEHRVAVQTFTVTASGETKVYRNTTKAWTAAELASLLEAAGFSAPRPHPDWPCNTGDLALWSAPA
jgi:hypothetical protein